MYPKAWRAGAQDLPALIGVAMRKAMLSGDGKECAALPGKWKRMADNDLNWPAMQEMECTICKEERDRRNRVMAGDDPRVRREPYLSAPFIHKNNEPKYHAMLLRAHE